MLYTNYTPLSQTQGTHYTDSYIYVRSYSAVARRLYIKKSGLYIKKIQTYSKVKPGSQYEIGACVVSVKPGSQYDAGAYVASVKPGIQYDTGA